VILQTLVFLSPSHSILAITNANSVSSPVTGVGNVHISSTLSPSNVLYIPSLTCNLLSISQITKALNYVALFYPTYYIFQNIHTKERIGSGRQRGGLYYLESGTSSHVYHSLAHMMGKNQSVNIAEIWLWHKQLSHPLFGYIRRLFSSLFTNCKLSDFICETCAMAKSHHAIFPLSSNKVASPFSLVHSDVWGPFPIFTANGMNPFPIFTANGMKWFVTFVDDCTRMTWVYLLKYKSDVCIVFRLFFQMILT
jgi:hypothetical protein